MTAVAELERLTPAEQSGSPAALETIGIAVSYGGVRAVDDVSFAVLPGSIVGLIGPNGAGKTTVFDAICGITALTSGKVHLAGREITRLNPSERSRAGLGRSFQDAKLFGSLTVLETLSCAFERHIRGEDGISTALGMPWVRRIERRIARQADELVDKMGLGAFRDKFISELSTGSRRIVDLACVLAHDPVVVLLDEPSSGIAQKETEALGPLLVSVKENTGCTMLLIEHDMPLVTSVSDQLVAMELGRIIATGTPAEVTHHAAVIEAYLGVDERAIARSGTLGLDGATRAAPARRPPAAKKATPKKAATKRAAPKKASVRKKAARKKAAGKKAAAKKAAPRKAATASSGTKKAAPRKRRGTQA